MIRICCFRRCKVVTKPPPLHFPKYHNFLDNHNCCHAVFVWTPYNLTDKAYDVILWHCDRMPWQDVGKEFVLIIPWGSMPSNWLLIFHFCKDQQRWLMPFYCLFYMCPLLFLHKSFEFNAFLSLNFTLFLCILLQEVHLLHLRLILMYFIILCNSNSK